MGVSKNKWVQVFMKREDKQKGSAEPEVMNFLDKDQIAMMASINHQ